MSNSDFLWRTLQDYNAQIAALTARLILILSFNTVVLSAIIGNLDALMRGFGQGRVAQAGAVLLAVIALIALVAIALVVRVLRPIVRPSPDARRSLVFFADVTREVSPDAFVQRLTAAGEDGLARDLAAQVVAVARVLCYKYEALGRVTLVTVALQLPAIAAVVLLRLLAHV